MLTDSLFGSWCVFACLNQLSLTNSSHDRQLSIACRRQPPSPKLWRQLQLLVHSVTHCCSMLVCVFFLCVVTPIGSCKFIFFIIHETNTLTSPASSPFVPNHHPHLCVHACDPPLCEEWVFPHTYCITTPTHTHTFAACVCSFYCVICDGGFCVFLSFGVWLMCENWQNLSLIKPFWNTFFSFLSVGDTQDQVDVKLTLNWSLYLFE